VRLAALWLAVVAACGGGSDAQLVEVTREDLVIGVDVVGELEAVDSTDIKPPPLSDVWDFKIASLAPEGNDVQIGSPVIAFDASAQVRALEDMNNEADAADKALAKKRDDAAIVRRDDELKIAQAEATLRKATLKTDAPSDLVAAVEQQIVKLDAESAQFSLDSAKQHAEAARRSDEQELQRLAEKAAYTKRRVVELQQNIARMQVVAPRAGTIVYPTNWQGEKHKVGDSVWRMEDVVKIVGLGKMVAAGQVDEVDVARIREGQAVVVRLDALPDAQLHGSIISIATTVTTKSRTDPSKIVHLKIALDPTRAPLRPGMRFRGQIEVEKLAKVVQVPADAVFATSVGPVAYRAQAGKLDRISLVVGQRTATAVEVKSGLSPGDRVSRSEPEPQR
jgi:hypothetical protein